MLLTSDSFSTLALIGFFALLLNIVLGGPASFYQPLRFLHPLSLWNGVVSMFERKLNRAKRSASVRQNRGMMFAFLCLFLLISVGMCLHVLFRIPGAEYAEIPLLAIIFASRQTFDATNNMRRLLKKSPASIDGILLPPALVRRQQKAYDHPAIIRASIELLALNFSERVIAPLLYYLLFGWIGVVLVCGISIMDQLVGYTSNRSREFGSSTALFHSILQWLPSRFTAFWIGITCLFAPSSAPLKTWKIMFSQAAKTKSANAGWPLGAMAGALTLTLGGPRTLHGSYIADGWIGTGSSKPQIADLKRAQWLYGISHMLLLMTLLLLGASTL